MKKAAVFTLGAAGLLVLASMSNTRANVDAAPGDALPGIDLSNLTDRIDTMINQATETTADVPVDTADANISAFLGMLRQSEGTASAVDPYSVCYAYRHVIQDFSDHPAVTGEWRGEPLSDAMCKNAGFGPGCISSAAGAYQITKGTWNGLKSALGLPDFSPASQDSAAAELIRRRGALESVKAGDISAAINKCRNEWASLPGNYAGQGQHAQDTLIAWYSNNGGTTA